MVEQFVKQEECYSMAISCKTKPGLFITSTESQKCSKSKSSRLLSLYKIKKKQLTLLHEHKTQHVFKQLSFLTSGTLLALTTKGDLYTIALEKNKKNKEEVKGIYKQTLSDKRKKLIKVNQFAHDVLNPTEVILLGGNECESTFHYVNMKKRNKNGAIRITNISATFLTIQGPIQGPEKIWWHNGILGIVYGKGANLYDKNYYDKGSGSEKFPIVYQKVLFGQFGCFDKQNVINSFYKTTDNTNHSNKLLPST